MRIEPLRYFGGAIRTSSCWGAVAWPLNEPALLVLRFADPRRRDAPPERDLRELFFFCCSCAILYWFLFLCFRLCHGNDVICNRSPVSAEAGRIRDRDGRSRSRTMP